MNYNIRSTRDAIVASLPFIKGRVLDVGGGRAKYKSIIMSKADEYLCLDIKPGSKVDVVGDVLGMPFKDSEFDTLVCNQVLEHVPEPEKLISESFRVLKSGGHFICTAPFLEPNHSDPGDFFRYTKQGLEFILTKYKFDIVESRTYGGFFSILFSFIKFSFFSPYKSSTRFRRRVSRYTEFFFLWLDGIHHSQSIYLDSLVISKKK